MFIGLTFFGIPIECFLRLAEVLILATILAIIFGIGTVMWQRKKDKDDFYE